MLYAFSLFSGKVQISVGRTRLSPVPYSGSLYRIWQDESKSGHKCTSDSPITSFSMCLSCSFTVDTDRRYRLPNPKRSSPKLNKRGQTQRRLKSLRKRRKQSGRNERHGRRKRQTQLQPLRKQRPKLNVSKMRRNESPARLRKHVSLRRKREPRPNKKNATGSHKRRPMKSNAKSTLRLLS